MQSAWYSPVETAKGVQRILPVDVPEDKTVLNFVSALESLHDKRESEKGAGKGGPEAQESKAAKMEHQGLLRRWCKI